MIVGIGIDIVEIDRVRRAVEREAFKNRVFTPGEIEYCENRGKSGAQSFAGRFAAKEAILKAFGTGLRGGTLKDMEIINDELGCPQVLLTGYFKQLAQKKGITAIWISISHSVNNAVAQCVLEK